MKPYARLRRDLLHHLPKMDPTPFKVYIALHLMADHRTGEVRATLRDLEEATGLPKSTLSRALKDLEEYYIARPKSGLIVIQRFQEIPTSGNSEGEEEAKSCPTSGTKIPTHGNSHQWEIPTSGTKIPTHGNSHQWEIPTSGTKIPTSGTSAPLSCSKKEEEDKNPPYSPPLGGFSLNPAGPRLVDPQRQPFGEFGCCLLTLEEIEKLAALMGVDRLLGYVEAFDLWVSEAPDANDASGVKRRNRKAYHTIAAWYRRDKNTGKLPRINHGHSEDPHTDGIAEGLRRRAERRAHRKMAEDLRGDQSDVRQVRDGGEAGHLLRIVGGSRNG